MQFIDDDGYAQALLCVTDAEDYLNYRKQVFSEAKNLLEDAEHDLRLKKEIVERYK